MVVEDPERTPDDSTADSVATQIPTGVATRIPTGVAMENVDVDAEARPRPLESADGRRQRDEIRARLFGTPIAPERIGRYVVLRRLGSGALGIVYACRDDALGRDVAVKVMRSSVVDTARGRREAQAMAQLADPNVAAVYEVGEHDGRTFIAMELVDGETLRQWQVSRTPAEILGVYLQAARGLAAAHHAGLIHRDFKPDNVMVAQDGRVRVLDFGLARPGEPSLRVESTPDDTPALDARLTATGATLGTPAYMALEQLAGGDVDARADQFAFAVALYEALSGARPFRGNSPMELVAAMLDQGPRAELVAGPRMIPEPIRAVLVRALATDRAQRFRDMHEVIAALTPKRRRVGPALAAVAVGIVGVAIVAAARTPDPCAASTEPMDTIWSRAIADDTRAGLRRADALDGRATRRLDELDEAATLWRVEARAVCEGDGDELEIRRVCLDDLRSAIEAASARVGEPGDTLPLLTAEGCAELRRRGAIPARANAAALEIRAAIDVAIREGGAGNFAAATTAVVPAVAMAREQGNASLLTEALIIRAAIESATGTPQVAEVTLTEAYEHARAAGHDRLAMRAATDLVNVLGNVHGRRERAEHWARVGEALAARLPDDDPAWARLLVNRGLMRLDHGDREGARVDLEGAITRLTAAYGPDNTEQRPALSNLAHVAMLDGDPDRARALLDSAIAIHERVEGVDHPEIMAPLVNRAVVSTTLGRFAEAHADLARAAAICARHDLTAELPAVRRNLADLLYEEGEHAAARGEIEQAIAGLGPIHGHKHPRVLQAQIELARILLAMREIAAARVVLVEVATVAEAELGADDVVVGEAWLVLAQVEADAGAIDATRRALEHVAPTATGDDAVCHDALRASLAAEVRIAEGQPTSVIEALEHVRSAAPPCPLDLARLELTLAKAHAAVGHARDVFEPIAHSARDRWRSRGPGWHGHADAVDAWLARTPRRAPLP